MYHLVIIVVHYCVWDICRKRYVRLNSCVLAISSCVITPIVGNLYSLLASVCRCDSIQFFDNRCAS